MKSSALIPSLAALIGATAAPANEPADTARYPYVAALSRVTGADRVYFCAGTLIAPRWILTAAHCFHNPGGARISARNIYAAVGQARLAAAGDEVQVDVERVFVHPGYEPGTQRNDLALVRLADVAGPLIADTGSPDPRAVTALGYGSFYEGRLAANALSRTGSPSAQLSDRLQRAPLRLVDPGLCASLGGGADDDAICASASAADACVGDSGGPLIEEVPELLDRLVGVVSLGSGCAVAQPVVRYTRVEPYAAWIAETIQQVDDPLE